LHPETGKRQQVRRRFATERLARDALAEIQNGAATGTFVSRSALTVEQVCANWLAGRHGIRPTTRAAYEHALQPLRERHGDLLVQNLTKGDLDQLVVDLVTGTFDDGDRVRRWTANSINPTLNIVSRMLADLVKQGHLVRDVAALVDRLKRPRKKLSTFTEDEVRRLLAHVERDRLAIAWHLALSGLRRGEIGGLGWADVDLDAGTLTVHNNRVSVNGAAVETAPKTGGSGDGT
jgi:integrase